MRQLIDDHIPRASARRIAPPITEAANPADAPARQSDRIGARGSSRCLHHELSGDQRQIRQDAENLGSKAVLAGRSTGAWHKTTTGRSREARRRRAKCGASRSAACSTADKWRHTKPAVEHRRFRGRSLRRIPVIEDSQHS